MFKNVSINILYCYATFILTLSSRNSYRLYVAYVTQVPPPSIDFTVPSPTIGIANVCVDDPPWMPVTTSDIEDKVSTEEETVIMSNPRMLLQAPQHGYVIIFVG